MGLPPFLQVASAQIDLLKHPLVTSLLDYKWRTYGRYVYFGNLFIYLVFLGFLTAFALTSPNPVSRTCEPVFVLFPLSLPHFPLLAHFTKFPLNYSTMPVQHKNFSSLLRAIIILVKVAMHLPLSAGRAVFSDSFGQNRTTSEIENLDTTETRRIIDGSCDEGKATVLCYHWQPCIITCGYVFASRPYTYH